MMARSCVTCSTTPGRCTFTATVCPPSASTARCTCAMEADPSGASSNSEKASSNGRPSSAATFSRATSTGNGLLFERRAPKASQYSTGSMSGCVEAICPSFTKVAPRSSSTATAFSGVRPSFTLCSCRIFNISRKRAEALRLSWAEAFLRELASRS